jgi:hypothetical protein
MSPLSCRQSQGKWYSLWLLGITRSSTNLRGRVPWPDCVPFMFVFAVAVQRDEQFGIDLGSFAYASSEAITPSTRADETHRG